MNGQQPAGWGADRAVEPAVRLLPEFEQPVLSAAMSPLIRGRLDLSHVSAGVRLEVQLAVQVKTVEQQAGVDARHWQRAVDLLASPPVDGVGDHELRYWETKLRSTQPALSEASRAGPLAALRFIWRTADRIWDGREPWQRDIWQAEAFGVAQDVTRARGESQIRLDVVGPPWLRTATKQWAKSRLDRGKSWATIRSLVSAMAALGRFLVDEAPDVWRLEGIDRRLALRYRSWLRESGLSEQTQHTRLAYLRALVADAERYLDLPTCGQVLLYDDELPRALARLPRPLDETVMSQLTANLDRLGEVERRMLIVLIETGRRIGELCTLRFDCLIQDPSGAHYLRHVQTKLATEAEIPISDDLVAIVRQQQAWVAARWPSSPFLFPAKRSNPDGRRPFGVRTFVAALKAYAAAIDLRDANGRPVRLGPHRFRHTAGTRMINSGVPQHVVQRYLGHASPEMTDVYAKLHDATLRAEFDRYIHGRVGITGEAVQLTAEAAAKVDARFLKERLAHQALPNGFCGLPLRQECPHANACLTCAHFETDVRFLNIHRRQRDDTRQLIDQARSAGRQRQVEMNQRVVTNLDRIIGALEPAGGD